MTNYEKMEKSVTSWVNDNSLTVEEALQRWEEFMNFCMDKSDEIVNILARKYQVAKDEIYGFLYLAMTDGL